MDDSYDVFRREIDGTFTWLGTRETFARAREKVVQELAASDHAFLIVSVTTGERTLIESRPNHRPSNP